MRSLFFLLAATVAACSPDYPMDKPGTWSLGVGPSANEANLRVMVANPNDLIAGRGEPNSLGVEAGPPVKRLLTGHRYPLPASDVVQLNINAPQDTAPQNGGNNVSE